MSTRTIQTVKGFRDFLPHDMHVRMHVLNIMHKVFQRQGFEPLETPALEHAELLLGKYGEESDRLVYTFEDRGGRAVALRYDQTVPTARVLATYLGTQIQKPWKRYQIQRVWRADKPQKGRYREFLQCDIDIFGVTSHLADAQIISTAYTILESVQLENIYVLINDRSVLFNTLTAIGINEAKQFSVIATLDKLDKKGRQEVENELQRKGISAEQIKKIFLHLSKTTLPQNLEKIIELSVKLGVPQDRLVFTPHLARGLDYYTSTIFEFALQKSGGNSIAGGGRYDKLIEQLSGKAIPAVGLSFGFDRLIESLKKDCPYKQKLDYNTVLVLFRGCDQVSYACTIVKHLLKKGICADIYPDENADIRKQLTFKAKRGYTNEIVVGADELEENTIVFNGNKTTIKEALSSLLQLQKRL